LPDAVLLEDTGTVITFLQKSYKEVGMCSLLLGTLFTRYTIY